jgi:hypothetical protein
MRLETVRKEFERLSPFNRTRDRGSRGLLCNWVREEPANDEVCTWPIVDMERYGDLLTLLPDKVVTNLEKGRLSRDGRYPILKAGLGFEELLSSIIVDGTAIGTSAAEARLVPALVIPKSYMAPGGIPGRTLRFQLRGRGTTLTTGATMIFRNRIAGTDVITGNTIQATAGVAAHATAQTNSQWEWEGHVVVRSVGAAGTVFGQGDADMAWADVTIANQHAKFSGSAGQDAPATAVWDTTADQFFQQTGQWSLATAYSIQAHMYLLEALN